MRINTNIHAINTYRQLSISENKLSKSVQRLSSGLRINRAGDDAAGQAISEKMRSQIRGLNMAERNTLDGVSLIQTAEGALQEVNNCLQRMRELAIQAANGTLDESDKLAIQNEIDQLTYDIDRIAKTTQFNANTLLRGSLLGRPFVTTNSTEFKYITDGTWGGNVKVDKDSPAGTQKSIYLNFTELPKPGDELVIGGLTIKFEDTFDSYNNGQAVVQVSDRTLDEVLAKVYNVIKTAKQDGIADALADYRVVGNSLMLSTDDTVNGLEIKFKDNDFETYAGKEMDIKLQIGANYKEDMNLLISVVDAAYLGIARRANHTDEILTAGIDAEAGVSLLTEEDANKAIGIFDNAIKIVSETRSKLGAYQNRLENTLNNLTTTSENITAAESRIRDVDMALEMSEYTKYNIINQAATAMLAQSNQLPQSLLQLLQR